VLAGVLVFWLFGVLVFGLFGVLVFGLFGVLVFGLETKQLTKRSILSPNEGIRRSVKNGLVVVLIVVLCYVLVFVLVFGLVGALSGALSDGLDVGLFIGLLIGLFIGLPIGLFFGLGATVQHYMLRFWFWRTRCTPPPWRYVAFLDDAVEQLLLRKVGGGYIFRHRFLQEYFASLETLASEEAPIVSASLQKPDEKE
jgi:hypothetical protein